MEKINKIVLKLVNLTQTKQIEWVKTVEAFRPMFKYSGEKVDYALTLEETKAFYMGIFVNGVSISSELQVDEALLEDLLRAITYEERTEQLEKEIKIINGAYEELFNEPH